MIEEIIELISLYWWILILLVPVCGLINKDDRDFCIDALNESWTLCNSVIKRVLFIFTVPLFFFINGFVRILEWSLGPVR